MRYGVGMASGRLAGRWLWGAGVAGAIAWGTPLALTTCDRGGGGGDVGSAGAGGVACFYGDPEPLFTLRIHGHAGPVPANTKVAVVWSAGAEPIFALDDPTTWKTLDDGVNAFCRVDTDGGPPVDLTELVCELWTSGATQVEVSATGYTTYAKTLTPKLIDGCDAPVPSEQDVELQADVDASAP